MGTTGTLPPEAAEDGRDGAAAVAIAAAWGEEDAPSRTGGPLSSPSSRPTHPSVLGGSSSFSASSSSSHHLSLRWWWRNRRGRLLVMGFGMAFVTTTALGGLALGARMVATTTTTTTTTTTADGGSHGNGRNAPSEQDDNRQEERKSTSFAPSSSSALLPWEPWERDAMTDGTCHAPSNVPADCCVGMSSAGGGPIQDHLCLAKGTEPYDRVKARAADFLRQHPVPQSPKLPLTTTTGWFPFVVTSTRSARPPFVPTDDCDTCRIIDRLIANTYTLTFQGDSVMGQAFTGLECELFRRGYEVNSTSVEYPHIEGLDWMYGLQRVETLRIARPSGIDDDNNGREATVVFRRMYRPIGDMKEVELGLDESDIFVFDHGLHYGPQDRDDMEEFENSTTALLAAARSHPRTRLVVWKETTPQHFNASGGHWTDAGNDCVPITEGHEGVHGAIVARAAQKAGYARVVNATGTTSGREQLLPNGETDLVVLPYRGFLVPLHDMHGGECTHFCASTYLYVPLWRSLRLALDAYLPS